MYPVKTRQEIEVVECLNKYASLPLVVVTYSESEFENLVSKLSPEVPWSERQIAANRLGDLRSQEALIALLNALPVDPFWMVRCAIIQALERIGSPCAVPVLQDVAQNDDFHIVRSYAAKAVERLSCEG
jgi:HEAT repeat protein